ncbi:MAG: ABC transporter permease [Lachnospiraceae bacterium]
MKKYIEITKIYFKNQLAWRTEAAFGLLFSVTKIIFAYLIWSEIFASKEMVAGFTFQTMLLYYVLSSFLTQIDLSSLISNEITQQIRNGKFSKYMILPVHVERYFWAMEAGMILFIMILNAAAGILWIVIFRIPVTITREPFLIAATFFMILAGLLFMAQLNYFLGILTLKFQEISTFLMIKDNLVQLVTGSIIPLILFPDFLIGVMKLLPFYYVTYLPAMLLLGKCTEEAISGLLVISAWCLVFFVLNQVTYQRLRTKFDGVGI